jgi:hypothetical protein
LVAELLGFGLLGYEVAELPLGLLNSGDAKPGNVGTRQIVTQTPSN